MAEVRYLSSRSYEWIVEGDIKACFDEISHPALMDRVRARVGDKRVLALVKAFLKSGILGEERILRETNAGTPQGSILSPLLSNVALTVLDEYIAQAPGGPTASAYERVKRCRRGLPNYRIIRFADDWCLMISGSKADAEALREEIAEVLIYTWQQVGRWLRHKHHRASWKDLRRLYYKGDTWWPASEERALFNPAKVGTTRYRYAQQSSPPPGRPGDEKPQTLHGTWGAPGAWKQARRVREAGPGNRPGGNNRTAPPAPATGCGLVPASATPRTTMGGGVAS
ncbi:reverse transcriptase/maturase family protein, partial [Streptomyces sp. NPDC006356]